MNEKIFHGMCEFIGGTLETSQILNSSYPEFAFIGRSNVGKSSLINSILNRKIARTSNAPGRTRQLLFFLVAKQLMLVDMPGYGYAKVSRTELKEMSRTIGGYLQKRHQLRRIFLLIDSRRGIKESDLQFLEFLMIYPVSTQIVLTKTDKISAAELKLVADKASEIALQYPICCENIILSSSAKKTGIDDIRKVILEVSN